MTAESSENDQPMVIDAATETHILFIQLILSKLRHDLDLGPRKSAIARSGRLRTGETDRGNGARTRCRSKRHHQARLKRKPTRAVAESARRHARRAGERAALPRWRRFLFTERARGQTGFRPREHHSRKWLERNNRVSRPCLFQSR